MSNILELKYYKSNKGLYINSQNIWGSSNELTKYYKFSGKEVTESFKKGWYFLEGLDEIAPVTKLVSGRNELKEYKLKDPTLENGDKIPLTLSPEQLKYDYDEDDDYEPVGDYRDVASLYERVFERTEDSWEYVAFEAELLGEIEFNDDELTSYEYKPSLSGTGWSKDSTKTSLLNIVNFRELDEILTSDLALMKKPCSISSENTYRIIRSYVQQHIDRSRAKIHSDYDFCFQVDKLVSIKPYTKKTPILKSNGRPYAKPRFNSKHIKDTSFQIFEMTHDKKKYQGYTVVDGFSGESVEDLVFNVKSYLEELIQFINRPLKQCECCDGKGYIGGDETFDKNKR